MDLISRLAVMYLDLFTKTYCRDKSVKEDLVFRCNQCEFEMSDGKCLVKVMPGLQRIWFYGRSIMRDLIDRQVGEN